MIGTAFCGCLFVQLSHIFAGTEVEGSVDGILQKAPPLFNGHRPLGGLHLAWHISPPSFRV